MCHDDLQLTRKLRSAISSSPKSMSLDERSNRKQRFFENSRYEWHRCRSIVRFVLLVFDHWRKIQTNPAASRRNRSSIKATHAQLNHQAA